jgi:hypothetical protein
VANGDGRVGKLLLQGQHLCKHLPNLNADAYSPTCLKLLRNIVLELNDDRKVANRTMN